MHFQSTDINFAIELDALDELASYRNEFQISDPNLIYLDGNSLGRLPKRTVEYMGDAIERGWGERLIRVWNEGWIDSPSELGAKIAKLVGAQADEILVSDSTSINLFKLGLAALRAHPKRLKLSAMSSISLPIYISCRALSTCWVMNTALNWFIQLTA